jgi:arabinofuranosyltransferase
MVLIRPEGALVAFLFLAWALVVTRQVWLVVRAGLLLCAVLAPVLIVKRLYYGDWLPATYYVKAHAGVANLDGGISYVRYALRRYRVIGTALVLGVGYAAWQRRTGDLARALPLLLVAGLWLVYVAAQGGDNMVGGRMIIPVLPLIYLAVASVVAAVPFRVTASGAVTCAVVLVIAYLSDQPVMNHIRGWRSSFEPRHAAGRHLKEQFPPGTLVAVNAAGIIPFYSEQPTIDMLGLNDRHIAHHGHRDRRLGYAHQAGDGAYVLSRRPDVILFGGHGNPRPSQLISDREIGADPRFQRDYERQAWPHGVFAHVRKAVGGSSETVPGRSSKP